MNRSDVVFVIMLARRAIRRARVLSGPESGFSVKLDTHRAALDAGLRSLDGSGTLLELQEAHDASLTCGGWTDPSGWQVSGKFILYAAMRAIKAWHSLRADWLDQASASACYYEDQEVYLAECKGFNFDRAEAAAQKAERWRLRAVARLNDVPSRRSRRAA